MPFSSDLLPPRRPDATEVTGAVTPPTVAVNGATADVTVESTGEPAEATDVTGAVTPPATATTGATADTAVEITG